MTVTQTACSNYMYLLRLSSVKDIVTHNTDDTFLGHQSDVIIIFHKQPWGLRNDVALLYTNCMVHVTYIIGIFE